LGRGEEGAKMSFSARIGIHRLAVLLGVVFVSTSAILIRLSDAAPLAIAAFRMGFSALIVLPLFIMDTKKEGMKEIQKLLGLGRTSKKHLWLCVLSGVFLALHFWAWITSLFHTSVAASTVLVNTQPLFVLLGGWVFLQERTPRRALPFMGTALLGSVLLALGGGTKGSETELTGNLLALLGALSVAGYFIIGRYLRRSLSTYSYTFPVYLVSSLTLVIIALLTRTELLTLPLKEYGIFIALAVFPTLLGHSIFIWALKFVRTSFISTAVLGEPVIASFFAVFLFQEVPGWATLIGGTLVLVSMYFFVKETGKDQNRSKFSRA
jgi:drug/metabolite transporter (DMT)-like permease